MNFRRVVMWFLVSTLLLMAISIIDLPLLAQGCSMCKTVAAAQSEQAGKALNRAILLLLIPPVAMMASILIWAFKFRNTSADL